ncbi:MAG: hypothetical protein Q8S73_12270 [Deltaproteobacteria bacterium]|nr:hypothetical protein [Myxococcales bacterium]MDP3214874.1 hypothetical protein [Deltaproteobacteria bacterium]
MTTGHTSRRAAWLGALLITWAVGAGCSARGSMSSTGDVGSTGDTAPDASSPTDGGKSADVLPVPTDGATLDDVPSKDAGAVEDIPAPDDVPAPMDVPARPDASGDLGAPTDAPACAPIALGSAVGAGVARGTTVGRPNLLSTSRCGLPMGGTLGGNQAPEAVFRWVAPSAGTWAFDTVGSAFDTLLYLRTGSCTGAELACNDDQSTTVGPSRVALSLSAGQEVLVVLDGFGTGAGDYVLNVGPDLDAGAPDAGPPPDLGFDTCSSASLGSAVGAGVARGTTVGRTNRLTTTGCGIPSGGTRGGDPAPDVVFRWAAPSAGSWTFDTVGSDFDTLLYVRRGGCEGAEIACNDDQATTVGPSRVTVALTAGQEVFVVLDGFSTLSGNYVLNVNASGVGDAGAPGGPCAGETTEGRCVGVSRVRYCSLPTGAGEARIVEQDCAADERCEIGPTGRAACRLLAECREGDTQCSDATRLRTCTGGRWVTSTCAPRCEDTGLAAACTLAVPVRTFAGTLTYAARPPNARRTDWDTARTYPGAGFMVLSQRGTSLIQSAVTDAAGRFTIEVPQSATADDALTFLALGRDPTAGGILYAVGDPSLPAGEHDIADTSRAGAVPSAARVWSWRWNVTALTPTLHITTAAGSGAARVFDHVRSAAASTRATFGRPGLRLLAWVGLNNRWDCGACFNTSPVQGFGERFESQIWYAGGVDESYWSDSTSGHELGHWVMESYGQSPDEGGRHQIGVPTFPGQAWSEGFATFFGSDLRNDPVNTSKGSGSMFWYDIAMRTQAWDTWNLPSASGGLQQFLNETEVSAILWSLRGASALPIYQALASERMTRPPYGRCYNRHQFTLPATGLPFAGVCEHLGIPAPHLADQLDAMSCTGFDRARLRAAIGAYPYPVDSPWCMAAVRPSTCAPRGDTPCP